MVWRDPPQQVHQRPQHGLVMRFGVRGHVAWRDGAESMVGPRGSAHGKQQPSALRVGKEGQVLQQLPLLSQANYCDNGLSQRTLSVVQNCREAFDFLTAKHGQLRGINMRGTCADAHHGRTPMAKAPRASPPRDLRLSGLQRPHGLHGFHSRHA